MHRSARAGVRASMQGFDAVNQNHVCRRKEPCLSASQIGDAQSIHSVSTFRGTPADFDAMLTRT
jgi:hypothetical protein